jgi:hypothetical protein
MSFVLQFFWNFFDCKTPSLKNRRTHQPLLYTKEEYISSCPSHSTSTGDRFWSSRYELIIIFFVRVLLFFAEWCFCGGGKNLIEEIGKQTSRLTLFSLLLNRNKAPNKDSGGSRRKKRTSSPRRAWRGRWDQVSDQRYDSFFINKSERMMIFFLLFSSSVDSHLLLTFSIDERLWRRRPI